MLPPLAHLEAGEALDDDPFAGLGVDPVDQLSNLRLARGVLDERLLQQALLGEKLLQLALDDLVDHLGRLLLVGELAAIDLSLLLDDLAGNVLAGHVGRIRRGNLHPEILHQLLEGLGARDEVRFAVHLDEYAQLGAVVDVGPDDALTGIPVGALAGLSESLLPEELDGRFEIALRRLERLLAVHHAGAGPVAEVLHQLRARGHALSPPPQPRPSPRLRPPPQSPPPRSRPCRAFRGPR